MASQLIRKPETEPTKETANDTPPGKERKPTSDDKLPPGGCPQLMMRLGATMWPKKNKHKPLGEDDCFIYFGHQPIIGVADGVGSWAKKGIDSGEYARNLITNAIFAIQKQGTEKGIDLKQVLNQAFLNTKAKGSCTACIITLRDNFLFAVNVGDSGFMVMRKNRIVYRSPIQQRKFNCPYQLGVSSGHNPESAQELVVKVQPGDTLVAATDGLFDNVYPHEIESIVKKCAEEEREPWMLAEKLAMRARELSLDREYFSPFTKAAVDAGRDFEHYRGGKLDDVTIIVGHIF